MPPIGETLREARLRRGIEIAEVSNHTKIRVKYLRALEDEDFSLLPGPAYARTFLRTYAEFLGLDPHVLAEEYRVQHDPGHAEEPVASFTPRPPRRFDRRPGAARPRPPGRPTTAIGLGGAGLVVIFLVIGLVAGGDEEPRPLAPPTTNGSESSPSDGEAAPSPKRRRERKRPPERIEVEIRPQAATYICADDGQGTVLFEDTIESPKRVRGKQIRLNLGNASGRIDVDGEPADFESGPNPIGLAISPEGVNDIPDGDRPCQ